MASPVKPSDFQALVPKPGDKVADAMLNMELKLSLKWYQFFSYMYNEDGTFTTAYQRDICDLLANCPT